MAFTGPDSFDLSLQAGEPAEGEAQIEVGLKGPGEADPDHEGVILPIHQGKYTVTIDATGLEGVADVDLPCDADGLVAVCTEYELYAGDVYNRNWDIGLAPGAESEAGDTGTITVTGEGEGLEFTEHGIDVLVGGPEFRMRALTEPEGFAAATPSRPRWASATSAVWPPTGSSCGSPARADCPSPRSTATARTPWRTRTT
ncbi:hypothetical protein LUW77_12615 [Streptomyces radiopugnans]|nr:hypothetical protein LUW77_12615 [Streptomyces radiopugnans]